MNGNAWEKEKIRPENYYHEAPINKEFLKLRLELHNNSQRTRNWNQLFSYFFLTVPISRRRSLGTNLETTFHFLFLDLLTREMEGNQEVPMNVYRNHWAALKKGKLLRPEEDGFLISCLGIETASSFFSSNWWCRFKARDISTNLLPPLGVTTQTDSLHDPVVYVSFIHFFLMDHEGESR